MLLGGIVATGQVKTAPLEGRLQARHRRDAADSRSRRLAQLAADARRLGLQPAQANHHAERPSASARVVVGAQPGPQPADAARLERARCSCPSPGGGVQALDAANGDLLWEYKATPPDGGAPRTSPMRNLAIYGDKVYVATADARLIALNARTGAVAWDHQVADTEARLHLFERADRREGADRRRHHRLPALQERRLLHLGARRPNRQGGVAHVDDRAARANRAATRWGDLPLMFRAGGDAWMPGSYDPNTNLIYWGTAQAKPWTRFARGTDGDALYTNCTLAIDPATGKIVWYYQHVPGETHDIDEIVRAHPRRRSTAARRCSRWASSAILWELDRKTGAFVQRARPALPERARRRSADRQGDVPAEHDSEAGRRARVLPQFVGLQEPARDGVSPRHAGLLHPAEPALRDEGRSREVQRVEGGGGSGGGRRTNLMHPGSPDGIGELLAMHARTGEMLWRHRTRTPPNTSALTTGGGLVVVGDWDRYLYVHDATTGKILFQTRLPTSVQGFPITYAVNGKPVPRGAGRHRRRAVGHDDSGGADAGEKDRAGRQRDVRVRVAGGTSVVPTATNLMEA